MDIFNAAETGNIQRIKTLLEEGVDVNSKNEQGIFPLYIASQLSNSTSSFETVKFLIDNGANVNLKTVTLGTTPLMAAVERSNSTSSLETVKLLLDNGADINIKNIYDANALYRASMSSDSTSSLETVKFLLDNGADIFVVSSVTHKNPIEICPTYECKKTNFRIRMEKIIRKRFRYFVKIFKAKYIS